MILQLLIYYYYYYCYCSIGFFFLQGATLTLMQEINKTLFSIAQ
jgi:hypothetical protein